MAFKDPEQIRTRGAAYAKLTRTDVICGSNSDWSDILNAWYALPPGPPPPPICRCGSCCNPPQLCQPTPCPDVTIQTTCRPNTKCSKALVVSSSAPASAPGGSAPSAPKHLQPHTYPSYTDQEWQEWRDKWWQEWRDKWDECETWAEWIQHDWQLSDDDLRTFRSFLASKGLRDCECMSPSVRLIRLDWIGQTCLLAFVYARIAAVSVSCSMCFACDRNRLATLCMLCSLDMHGRCAVTLYIMLPVCFVDAANKL